MTKKADKISFEDSIEKLETIVKELESGELPLEDAIEKFELGIKHSVYCNDLLDKTEKKISILLKDTNGNIKEEPFNNK
ncbi:MAG: exodeoxyribonuclease VII small subunit [Desulfobacteraceae bacterium]|nr:exodeoxyribonuclease VII small subunit [Desulfobacteraceae bacterium]